MDEHVKTPLFQYAYYPEGAYIITQNGEPVPPEQLCFMLEASANLKAELETLKKATEALSHLVFLLECSYHFMDDASKGSPVEKTWRGLPEQVKVDTLDKIAKKYADILEGKDE